MHSIYSNLFFCLKLNYTGDVVNDEFDPDRYKDGMTPLINAEIREEFYFFIAHYVRKVFSDSKILKHLKSMPGVSFLDMISTSDIAYVLTIVKNGQKGWDEKMKGNDPNEETLDSGTYIHVANVVF